MIKHLFFDLGQTLVQYYTREEFKTIFPEIFDALYSRLAGRRGKPKEQYRDALWNENRENADFSVRSLAVRLGAVFGLAAAEVDAAGLCAVFMAPLLSTSSIDEDTIPVLEELRGQYDMALVSNTPWGCPKAYFERELEKYGIEKYLSAVAFCTDVGFRKPHRSIFEHALGRLNARPEETLMVGDRVDWDVAGARACGLAAVLIGRDGREDYNARHNQKLAGIAAGNRGRDALAGC